MLHHRLVKVGDKKGIDQVKWTAIAYESNLKRRRERTLRDGNVGGDGEGGNVKNSGRGAMIEEGNAGEGIELRSM